MLISLSSSREPKRLLRKTSLSNMMRSPRPETTSSPSTSFATLSMKKRSRKPSSLMSLLPAQLPSTSHLLRLSLLTRLPSLLKRLDMLPLVVLSEPDSEELESSEESDTDTDLELSPLPHSSPHLEMVSLDLTADHGAHPHLTLIMVPSSLVDSVDSVDFVATTELLASLDSTLVFLEPDPMSPQSLPREPSLSLFQRPSSSTTTSPLMLLAPSRKNRL